jgi:hypothetical protein
MNNTQLIIEILKSNNEILDLLAKYDKTEITQLTVKGQIENNNALITLIKS